MEDSDKSDLDILVSFSKTPSLLKFIELKNFLSEKLNLQVDLVLKDSLKESIIDYILNQTIKL
ncbi:Putative nucleotidyltransferase [Ignavibacterium album JCM 16511]|uniref:Putative nucleotidyltransferase n=1 Tax=Ignavibacterium album (strain DSM 19864 / JCM 16511 / NBRC 101810 / Mat9-16) TaxID=945713 RepID=I0AMA5_IGNAJ|nr:Putative nucleotidyltransferase [Ignavibacterium album JCM 16511]